MIRVESGERLEGFLRDVETHARSRPKTSTTGRVTPITVANDGSIGGWGTVEEFVGHLGATLYPGWQVSWRYRTGQPLDPQQCATETTLNVGDVRAVTIIATAP